MKFLVLFLLIFTASSAQARSVSSIVCDAIVYTEFEVLEKEGVALPLAVMGHGGEPFEVKGEQNEVIFNADGRWLGVDWYQNGEPIAHALFLLSEIIETPRVMLVFNPKNLEEQVSLNCSANLY